MSERAILAGRRESEEGMRERWDDASESPMRVESQHAHAGRRRAGSQMGARAHEHAGGIRTGVRGHTCGFAPNGPAGRAISILDRRQQRPASNTCSFENQRNNQIQNIRIYIRLTYGEEMVQIKHHNGYSQQSCCC